jgi:hypothetical protein
MLLGARYAAGYTLVCLLFIGRTLAAFEDHLVGQPPATIAGGIERPAAIKGEEYAVIAPLYLTADPLSLLRLYNGGVATATFEISVVGSPSGNNYGTASFQIPPRASTQYSVSQIITAAGATSISPSDSTYSFYLRSAEKSAGYQHILFSNSTGFFENLSLCKYSLNEVLRSPADQAVITNVHTSRLVTVAGGYPSQIDLHNFSNNAATYRLSVIEAENGTVRGSVDYATAANSTYAIPFSYFEQQIGWVPSGTQYHANIVLTDRNGGPPSVVLGHSILNTRQTNTVLNLGMVCAVNPPVG